MKRRQFLSLFGAGAAVTATAVAAGPAGVPKTSLNTVDLGTDECLCPYEQGKPRPEHPPEVIADCEKLWGEHDHQSKARLAVLTNGRLWRMIVRFNKRYDRENDLVGELRWLVGRHPAHFRRVRHYYGLSFHDRWFEDHVKRYVGC